MWRENVGGDNRIVPRFRDGNDIFCSSRASLCTLFCLAHLFAHHSHLFLGRRTRFFQMKMDGGDRVRHRPSSTVASLLRTRMGACFRKINGFRATHHVCARFRIALRARHAAAHLVRLRLPRAARLLARKVPRHYHASRIGEKNRSAAHACLLLRATARCFRIAPRVAHKRGAVSAARGSANAYCRYISARVIGAERRARTHARITLRIFSRFVRTSRFLFAFYLPLSSVFALLFVWCLSFSCGCCAILARHRHFFAHLPPWRGATGQG